MKTDQPILITDRLRIFEHTIDRGEGNAPRTLYHAWLRACVKDMPRPVAYCVIFKLEVGISSGHFVEWIEVTESMRRQKIATELLDAINALIIDSEVVVSGVTDAGEAFEEYWMERYNQQPSESNTEL